MLKPGEIHPDYIFDSGVKEAKYSTIIRALDGKGISYACTFPGLSNYKFERQLIERYPGIRIHCFEKDRGVYDEILDSFEQPKEVTFINSVAEAFLVSSSTMYDLIFFDYCGGPEKEYRGDYTGIVDRHMVPGGVFAVTEYTARGNYEKYPPFVHRDFRRVVQPLRYDHMEFTAYRKVDNYHKTSISSDDLLVVQMKRPVIKPHDSPRIPKLSSLVRPHKKYKHRENEVGIVLKGLEGIEDLDGILLKLPLREQKIFRLYKRGLSQKEVAKRLHLTQGAISTRIRIAMGRVEFIRSLPVVSEVEFKSLKSEGLCDEIDIAIIKSMRDTTCQSVTAEMLNKDFGFTGDAWMTQVKVRYRFEKCMERLRLLPGYVKVYQLLDLIHKNPYKLHFVRYKEGHFDFLRGKRGSIVPKKKRGRLRPWTEKQVVPKNLSALSSHFDPAMIDLIDSVFTTGSFGSASRLMNSRRNGWIMKYPYTPVKVSNCWVSIKRKLQVITRMPVYAHLKSLYERMEAFNGDTHVDVV
jgi:predicted transcriptional regulator